MSAPVATELLRLAATGRIALDGACWSPAGRARDTAIALFPGTAADFCHPPMGEVGPLLAAAGYRVLSLNRRDHGMQYGFYRFHESCMDQRLAVDWLTARGATRVVMAGHSYGTLTVPGYLGETGDARVPAALLFAPLGDLRAASVTIVGGRTRYDAIVAECRARVADGRGDEAFLIPPMVPDALPLVHTHAVFLDKRGPEAQTAGAALIARTGDRPLLGIRDPADPYPATLPPAREQLEAANPRLDYVLLDDIRDGRMDADAHYFTGRAGEVTRIVLDWLAAHGLDD
jgi:pimeloyl-ACP methyl ester carboxylesterase